MIRKLVFVLFCITGAVFADPQLVMSQQDPSLLKSRISQLNEMRKNTQFSDAERERLDELWKEASDIEIMNDRCGTISINEELDESCGHFYQYELPKFETDFFKLTGEIRLSPNRLSNAIEQRRQAINQCYEALQIEAFYPTRFFTLEGNYTPEPLTQGVEVSYNFKLQENHTALQDINTRLRQWLNICGNIIYHSDNSGALAPIFVELVQQSRNQAGEQNGGLYFELDPNYRQRLYVKTRDGVEGVYYLNGKEIFNYKINGGKQIFSINLGDHYNTVQLVQGNRWKDKVIFDDGELENGLMGRFVWGRPRNTWFSPKSSPTVSAPKAEYKSYNNDSEPIWDDQNPQENYKYADSEKQGSFGVFIQALGGINLAFGEADEVEVFREFAPEGDSIFFASGYLEALLVFEFRRDFAIGIGGGVSWNSVNYESCDFIDECEEINVHQEAAPIITGEINIGDGMNGGIRFSYVMDSDLPTFYLGGFVELGNLLGLEIGWQHADGMWNNIYMGLSLRLPPRHFSERLKEAQNKKK